MSNCVFAFSKAIVFANRGVLGVKLAAIGAYPHIVGWVRSFLDDVVSKETAVPSEVIKMSIMDSILFPVIVHDLDRDLQLFCWTLAEDNKIRRRNKDFLSIK